MHSPNCSSVVLLEREEESDAILFCLPQHITDYLQPLDWRFLKSLEIFDSRAYTEWMQSCLDGKLERLQVGELLTKIWRKSVTGRNTTSCFRATGVFPGVLKHSHRNGARRREISFSSRGKNKRSMSLRTCQCRN